MGGREGVRERSNEGGREVVYAGRRVTVREED